MTGTRSARGGLGWVILVIALAVPGVLFYNWWSYLKTDREKSVAAKARGRMPDGGVFQSSPNSKLTNPMAPAVSVAAVAAPVAASTDAVPAAAADKVQVTAVSPQAPPLKRDPTISPFEQVRLLEEEEARRRAAEDMRNQATSTVRSRRTKPSVNPASLVNLQGIVSNSESGFKAIVNDEVLGAGEFAGHTSVKIVKISNLTVTFEYRGKTFSKGVSRD